MLSERDLAELRRQERWSSAFAYPIYFLLIATSRFWLRYRYEDLTALRERIWKEMDAHGGPVILAANHLTLIDSFLIFEAITPFSRAGDGKRVPWSTPEYRNYYHLGGWLRQRAIRALMYLCRCIPFLREGEDEASVRWRETAFAKLIQILRGGGMVFVYPEAGRSRSGWFEKNKPKDFLGRLALEVPKAKFLCVYLRSDTQHYTTVIPPLGSTFRVEASLVDGAREGESPRQVSQRLFGELARLQDEWWKRSSLRRACGGNDLVDLKWPLLQENIDPSTGEADEEWLDRHLTPKEKAYWSAQPAAERFRVFWKLFAAKEAAHKALVQDGLTTSTGRFVEIEIDLFRRRAHHLPTGVQMDFMFTDDDEDKLHCVAILRGGYIGDDAVPADALWQVTERAAGSSPGDSAREKCLEFIAESNDDIPSSAVLAFGSDGDLPRIYRAGKEMDWGVSLSHSGRFVACSLIVG